MALVDVGWDTGWARSMDAWAGQDVEPGRVVIAYNYLYRVHLQAGDVEVPLAGRLKHRAVGRGELPAVGDWVVVRRSPGADGGAIVAVLPRRSRFSRKLAGPVTGEQVVAANVDVVFIVMAMDADFSVRRLERYLVLAGDSGASPVVLLTKPDRTDDPARCVAAVREVAGEVPVLVLNPRSGDGLDQLEPYLTAGRTGALLGSSGVGKTTLVNRLTGGGDARPTRDVRASDAKGRHTTRNRELVALPGGALLIDTPGMRELQLWETPRAALEAFGDIEALAAGCHFGDCRHRGEPQCAVEAAAADGRLSAARVDSYRRLQDELAALARRREGRAQIDAKRRSRVAARALRKHPASKRR